MLYSLIKLARALEESATIIHILVIVADLWVYFVSNDMMWQYS